MATINTTGAGGNADRLNPTIQTTLGRLGRALTIRDGKGAADVPAAGDSVQISPAAASASAGGVGQIGAILADLESLVAQAAQDGAGAEVRSEAQRRIDEAVATISKIAGSGSVGEVGSRLDSAPGYSVVTQNRNVSDVAISSSLKYDERVDVDLALLHSAQVGGFYLSFGGSAIDLGAGSSFSFEITGNTGSRIFEFASGTSLNDIAGAVNIMKFETGVEARVSATGIRLVSEEFGGDAFVTLDILNNGSIAGSDGIYLFNPDDTTRLMPYVFKSFQDGASATDLGRDLVAFINGNIVQAEGDRLSASLLQGRLDVSFSLDNIIRNPFGFHGNPVRMFTVFGGRSGPSFLSNKNPTLENVQVENRALGAGESLDINLRGYREAKKAGVYMEFDIDPENGVLKSDMSIAIESYEGDFRYDFQEGQSLAEIADMISATSEETGTQALVSGGHLRIESVEMGRSQHVTMRILDAGENVGRSGDIALNHHGGATAARSIYTFEQQERLQTVIENRGRSLTVFGDGFEVVGRGRHISGSAFGGELGFEFDVALLNGVYGEQTFGVPAFGESFDAFTIHGVDGVNVDGPIGDIPLPGAAPVSQALAGYASSGADAGDFDGALDAIRSLRERGDGGIPPESLAALRRDVIAGAGKSLGINTASNAQRALDLLGGGGS